MASNKKEFLQREAERMFHYAINDLYRQMQESHNKIIEEGKSKEMEDRIVQKVLDRVSIELQQIVIDKINDLFNSINNIGFR